MNEADKYTDCLTKIDQALKNQKPLPEPTHKEELDGMDEQADELLQTLQQELSTNASEYKQEYDEVIQLVSNVCRQHKTH